jgi:hypothetical protein
MCKKASCCRSLRLALHTLVCPVQRYMYGGDQVDTPEGDLWRFNLLTRDWELVIAQSEIPPARILHAAAEQNDAL